MEDDPRSPLLDEDDDLGASSAATSTLQAALSLVVSTAGGIGMVTLPGSVAKLGYLESALLLVFAGALSASSLAMLDWSRGVVGGRGRSPPTYADLVASALGRSGSRVLDVLTLLYCFGQIVSYLSAIGGQARAILGLAGVNLRTHEAIACSGIVLFPLALTPERLSMMVAGTLGTLCLSYIVAVVVLGDGVRALATGGGPCSMAGGEGTSSDIRPEAFSSSWVALMKNAPIFLFAMNASVIFVPVRHDLDPQRGRPNLLIGGSTVASGVLYFACAGAAYLAYCGAIPENLVDVYSITYLPGLLARAFLSVELGVAAAGIYVPLARSCLGDLIPRSWGRCWGSASARVLATGLLVSTGTAGSIVLGGALALPLATTSALCVTAQMFVLPGLCVSKFAKSSASKAGALAFAFSGALFGAISLVCLFVPLGE